MTKCTKNNYTCYGKISGKCWNATNAVCIGLGMTAAPPAPVHGLFTNHVFLVQLLVFQQFCHVLLTEVPFQVIPFCLPLFATFNSNILQVGGAVVAQWLGCWTQDSRVVGSIHTPGMVRF